MTTDKQNVNTDWLDKKKEKIKSKFKLADWSLNWYNFNIDNITNNAFDIVITNTEWKQEKLVNMKTKDMYWKIIWYEINEWNRWSLIYGNYKLFWTNISAHVDTSRYPYEIKIWQNIKKEKINRIGP